MLISSGESFSEVSHPPHLTSSWSSSLIPFCAYKTDLNISGSDFSMPGISFPLCSSFLPTILEGQLCYELTLNGTSGQGKRNELMLVLDYNEDRSLQATSRGSQETKMSRPTTINFDTAIESVQSRSAKVHINTLSPFVGFGGGIYMMYTVKRMTAKEDFLKMPLKDRNCEVESFEDCRTRKLLEYCKCAPWEGPDIQVKRILVIIFVCRTWKHVTQRDVTASRIMLLTLSTVASPVKGSMLMSSGLKIFKTIKRTSWPRMSWI